MYDRTSRRIRTAFTGAALVALSLGVSACASGNSSDQGEQASPQSSGTSSSAEASATPSPSDSSASPSASATPTQPAPSPTVSEAEPTPQPSGTVESAPASPTPEASTDPSHATPSAEAEQPSPGDAKSGTCGHGNLHVSVNASNGAAGSSYYTLTFTNSGSEPCKLTGYPSVSFIDDSGQTIGSAAMPATDLGGTGATLQPGQSTSAILRSTQPELFGPTCQKTNASGLRIAATDGGDSLDVPFPSSACANPGVSQLSVSKVGVQG